MYTSPLGIILKSINVKFTVLFVSVLILVLSNIYPVSYVVPFSVLNITSIEQSVSKLSTVPFSELYAYYPLNIILIGSFGLGISN